MVEPPEVSTPNPMRLDASSITSPRISRFHGGMQRLTPISGDALLSGAPTNRTRGEVGDGRRGRCCRWESIIGSNPCAAMRQIDDARGSSLNGLANRGREVGSTGVPQGAPGREQLASVPTWLSLAVIRSLCGRRQTNVNLGGRVHRGPL